MPSYVDSLKLEDITEVVARHNIKDAHGKTHKPGALLSVGDPKDKDSPAHIPRKDLKRMLKARGVLTKEQAIKSGLLKTEADADGD